MIPLQVSDGLLFWPEEEIASWSPEFRHRWRVVRHNGDVAHAHSPPPPGHWVPLGEHWVEPRLLTATTGGWQNPAGFLLGRGPLKAGQPIEKSPPVQGLPFSQDQVFMVSCPPDAPSHWQTDAGEFTFQALSEGEVKYLHPDLFRATHDRYFNRRHLRKASGEGAFQRFFFRGGQEVLIRRDQAIVSQFGLPSLTYLLPRSPGLYRGASVREWPFELARVGASELRDLFKTPRQLIANVIWQAFRMRTAGCPLDYGRTHRDFWYWPMVKVLGRAGYLTATEMRWDGSDSPAFVETKKIYAMYERILRDFVRPERFFTLREFGFLESRPDLRHIGDRLPQVLVVGEKESLRPTLDRLASDLGVSTWSLSGQPSLLGSECLAEELAPYAPITILALVDHDPYGGYIARAVAEHLTYFDVCVDGVQSLLRPQDLTSEEIELLTLPCLNFTKRDRNIAERWLSNGGGIGGQPLCMCVNLFRPYERVKNVVEKILVDLTMQRPSRGSV